MLLRFKNHQKPILAAVLIVSPLLLVPLKTGAQSTENTYLRCEGESKRWRIGFGGWPEQKERLLLSVNVNTNSGSGIISGIILAGPLYEKKPIVFDVNENTFLWDSRVKFNDIDILTAVKIDRVTGLLEITELMFGGQDKNQYFLNMTARAICKRVENRAF